MTGVLTKRRNLDTEVDRQTDTHTQLHVEMKTEIGVILLQAKEPQRLPANHQKLERGTDSPVSCSEGTNTADVLISSF